MIPAQRFKIKILKIKIRCNLICLYYGISTAVYWHFLVLMFCRFPFAIYCYIVTMGKSAFFFFFFFCFFFSCSPVLSYICLYQIWLSLQTSMKKTNINTTISIQILKDALLYICPCIFLIYTICFPHDRSLPTFRLCLWF